MSDLISRQEAIDAIIDLPNCHNGYSDVYDKACVIGVLEGLPSAERKGKWIKRHSYDRRDNFYVCSECGRVINIICGAHLDDYPFCHCGAIMIGVEE